MTGAAPPHGATARDASGADPIAFGDLLARLAEEIAALGWLSRDLEAIAGHLAAEAGMPVARSRDLQRLDLMTQSLDDVHRVLRRLASAAPAANLDRSLVAGEIVLAGVRNRLTGVGSCDAGAAKGGVTLF